AASWSAASSRVPSAGCRLIGSPSIVLSGSSSSGPLGSWSFREESDRCLVEALRVLEVGPVAHLGHLEDLRLRDDSCDGAGRRLVFAMVLPRGDDHGRGGYGRPLLLGNEVSIPSGGILEDQEMIDALAGVGAPVDGLAKRDEVGETILLIGDEVLEDLVDRFPARIIDGLGALGADPSHV